MKTTTRVCILSGYPPGIGRGAEQVYVLAQAMRQLDGIDLTILANRMEDTPQVEEQKGISVIRVWQPGSWGTVFKTIRCLIRLKPHILHIHHPHLYYGSAAYTAIFITLLMLAARLKGIKSLVWWEHVYPLHKITRKTMETYHYRTSAMVLRLGVILYTRIIGLLAERVLVQTEADMQVIRKDYGVKNSACLVIGMQAKRMDRDDARCRLGLSGQQRVLLVFGFISPFKGIDHAIEAFGTVHAAYPDAVLLIAGCPHPRLEQPEEYLHSLKTAAEETGLGSHIIFYDDYIPADEHSLYYSAADIVLLPYISSLGPSSVGMEAFLYGIPVVATDVDFIRDDIKNGVTGLLVPPADSASLAGAVTKLFGNENLYRSIVDNIAAVARSYSSEEIADKLRGHYLELQKPLKSANR